MKSIEEYVFDWFNERDPDAVAEAIAAWDADYMAEEAERRND